MKRRTFLKGAAVSGAAVGIGFDMSKARAEMRQFKIARTTETRSTCPYCSVSCGVIIHTLGDKSKNVRGEVVNRTPGIAWIGGCTDTNEFNFLQWKAISAFGVPYRDTQARV